MRSRAWQNSEQIQIVSNRVAQSLKRQFLVFIVPSNSLPSPILEMLRAERNFDVAVRFYDDPGLNSQFLDDAEFVMTGGLSKFHAASQFLASLASLNNYDGYLFLDGDLEFNARQLSGFLSFVKAANLDLAQPSLTRDSYCYWNMAYHQPIYLFRETSFVEVMAPYMSKTTLQKALPTFTESISSYGLDMVWPSLVEDSMIGVVDAFQIRHRQKVDHISGPFYKYLQSIGVDFDEERRNMIRHYGVKPKIAHSRRGYFKKDRGGMENEMQSIASVPIFGAEKMFRSQKMIDIVMALSKRLPSRDEDAIDRCVRAYLSGESISSVIADTA